MTAPLAAGAARPAQEHAVERWLGPSFFLLHPALQALHRSGGRLHGPVDVVVGEGVRGIAGRLLARRLGMPDRCATVAMTVVIRSDADALHWSRQFGQGRAFVSVFEPAGVHPAGYWIERSGPLQLRLGVEIIAGRWHWRQRGLRLFSIALPRWLMPRTVAHKEADGDAYRFSVEVRLPLLGTVLAYGGLLQLEKAELPPAFGV